MGAPRASKGSTKGKGKGEVESTYVKRVDLYKLLPKWFLRSYPTDRGHVLQLNQAAEEALLPANLRPLLDADCSELLRRPSMGINLAAASIDSCQLFGHVLAESFPAVLEALTAEPLIEHTQFLNLSRDMDRDPTLGGPATKNFLRSVRKLVQEKGPDLAKVAEAAAAVYLGLLSLLEVAAVASDFASWAAAVPEVKKQPKSLQSWLKDPTNKEKLYKAVEKAIKADMSQHRLRRFGDLSLVPGDSSVSASDTSGASSDSNAAKHKTKHRKHKKEHKKPAARDRGRKSAKQTRKDKKEAPKRRTTKGRRPSPSPSSKPSSRNGSSRPSGSRTSADPPCRSCRSGSSLSSAQVSVHPPPRTKTTEKKSDEKGSSKKRKSDLASGDAKAKALRLAPAGPSGSETEKLGVGAGSSTDRKTSSKVIDMWPLSELQKWEASAQEVVTMAAGAKLEASATLRLLNGLPAAVQALVWEKAGLLPHADGEVVAANCDRLMAHVQKMVEETRLAWVQAAIAEDAGHLQILEEEHFWRDAFCPDHLGADRKLEWTQLAADDAAGLQEFRQKLLLSVWAPEEVHQNYEKALKFGEMYGKSHPRRDAMKDFICGLFPDDVCRLFSLPPAAKFEKQRPAKWQVYGSQAYTLAWLIFRAYVQEAGN